VHIPSPSKLTTPGSRSPLKKTDGARASPERRCSGMRLLEDQSIGLESLGCCVWNVH